MLETKVITKLNKPLTDKAVLGKGWRATAYVNCEAWGNGSIMFYEDTPAEVKELDKSDIRQVTPEELARLESYCTVPVYPREVRVYDDDYRLSCRYVTLETGNGRKMYVEGNHLSAILKRAGKKADGITYMAQLPEDNCGHGTLLVKNGRKLGITGIVHPEQVEGFDDPIATFGYTGPLPQEPKTKTERFTLAHQQYRYIVREQYEWFGKIKNLSEPSLSRLPPEIVILEDNWVEEKCVYSGPVNGSKAAREWIAL